MKRIIGIFLLLSTYYVSNAQDNSDSLLKVWNDTSVIDSVRADALKEYIYQKHFRSNVDSAVILAEKHLAFSKKINHSNTILNSYLINSMVNARGGNYDKAIGFSFEALNDTSCEKKWSCQSTFYNVLGNVYTLMNVPKKALVQYRKALNLNIENAGDSTTIGFLYSNIGNLYHDINKDSALYFFNKSLKIQMALKDDFRIAQVNWNIGRAYSKNPKKAIEYYKKSYAFFKKINYLSYLATLANNISISYLNLDNITKASEYAEASLQYADKSKSRLELRNAYSINFKIQEIKNNYEEALKYFELSTMIKDSLNRQSNVKALHEAEIKYEYEKKASADSVFYAEEQKIADARLAVKDAELLYNKHISNGIFIVLFIIVFFSVFLLLRYQKIQSQNDIIDQQKEIVSKTIEEIKEKSQILERKNRETIESINYARYIQRSLYPDEVEMNSYFHDFLVFNLPKDIVGGDFHWFKSFGNKAIAIAADCTGHGVPGGFITVLGNLFIESSTGDKPNSPSKILADINNELVTVLKQEEEDAIQDGMDLAVCLIDKKESKLLFSGSRNGLFIVNKNGDVNEVKGDFTPVGGNYSRKEKFNKRTYQIQELKLNNGDWVFMYSDGYYDQFGGPKNKSMGSIKFKEILSNSIKENKLKSHDFKKHFFDWMGDNHQLDDVLLLGFTV